MGKLEFLKIYDITSVVNNHSDLKRYKECLYDKVFIQKDVFDYHIFRIMDGVNEEWEWEDGCCMLEMENISVDEVRAGATIIDTIVNVLKKDLEEGLCSWDSMEVESIEEATEEAIGGYPCEVLKGKEV